MIFRILAKNVADITKAAFYLSRLTFCQKNVLEKNKSTLALFQGKNLRVSPEKCLEKKFWGNKFWKKKGNSNHFLTLGEKVSNFSPKVPSRAIRTAFYVSKDWILGKNFLEVYSSLIFSDTAQNFLDFMRKFFCRIINYAIHWPKWSFWEKFPFELCTSHSRISSDNRCGFIAQNFLVGLSNLNPNCPDHIFSEKNLLQYLSISLFLDCEQKLVRHLTKNQWLGCRNCPLRFPRFFNDKNFLTRKNFSHQFLTLS